MGRFGIAVLVVALGVPSANAWAQSLRYPRVYGATGRPYGPTQAHYQYQRQYGRPWHGYGGITANINTGVGAHFVQGYPGACLSSYGYDAYFNFGGCGLGYGGIIAGAGYSPYLGYTAPIPPVLNGYPPVLPYNDPFNNPVINDPAFALGLDGVNPLNTPVDTEPLPPISTAEAKLKSVRAQAQGDIWFQKQEYHKAFDRYKASVAEAQDRGEAHLRLAVCYAALGHLDLAARQLKRGIAADPQFITKIEPLSKIYGSGNSIAQSAMVHKATLWAKDDIRDPDRLFLLGALLYLQGDDRAKIPLETGMTLSGGGDHFRSFLTAARENPLEPAGQAAVDGADPAPAQDAPAPNVVIPPAPGHDGSVSPLPLPSEFRSNRSAQDPMPAGPDLAPPNR